MTRILLIAIALLALAGCESAKSSPPAVETVRDVALLKVERASLPDWVEAVGTVKAQQTSQLSAEIVGTVREVRVQEGERVSRGQVLVVLEDAQQQAAVSRSRAAVQAAQQEIAAAQADDQLAQATLKRYETLREKKAVSPHEFDEVQARSQALAARKQGAGAGLAQASAAEAQAQAMLSFTRIRAPFDGVITSRNADPGALASPGMPLLTVEDTRRLRLEATVNESDLQYVKAGATAAVAMDALQSEVQGKVMQIVPAADPASRSFVVKIELPADARLHSGMFGRAHFARGERQAVMLPRAAVLDHGQLHGVYLLGEQNTINLHYVTLGAASGNKVEILSGLQGGERVVAEPGGRELAGKKLME